jgi:HSP20 family protein
MAVVKWDPLAELQMMQNEMNRMFNISRAKIGGENFDVGVWLPAADIFEDDQEVVVKMEIPEVDLEDVNIRMEGECLIIEGERKMDIEEKRHNYHRIERCYGRFCRTFALPADIDREKVSAACQMGVLKITLSKKKGSTNRQLDGGNEPI